MSNRYQTICGITEEELRAYLEGEVNLMAEERGVSKERCYARLAKKYDGYHFVYGGPGLYNPYSLLNALTERDFGDYWFETGTPTFLTDLLRTSRIPLDRLSGGTQDAQQLQSIEDFRSNPLPIMFQTGYLTIKDYDEVYDNYVLDFPNDEVRTAFVKALVPAFLNQKDQWGWNVRSFVDDLNQGEAERFMRRLQAFYADMDYQIAGEAELYYQNTLYVFFMLLGQYVRAERHTSRGRSDIVVETADYVYVMELKLDGSSDEALRQINAKQYAAPYAMSGKRIFKIGVNFSSETRGITDWKTETEP